MPIVTLEEMNSRFETLLGDEGYATKELVLEGAEHPGRLAENPYFAVAFEPFSTWNILANSASILEANLTNLVEGPSVKVWDTYLLLACQEAIVGTTQLNELVQLQYDLRRVRKLVVHGVGDAILRIDDLVRPFLALKQMQRDAMLRDPLRSLQEKLSSSPVNQRLLSQTIEAFKNGQSLNDIT